MSIANVTRQIDSAKCQSLMLQGKSIVLNANRSCKRRLTALNNDRWCWHQAMTPTNSIASASIDFLSTYPIRDQWIKYIVFNFLESEESQYCCIYWSTRWRRIQVACEEVSQAVDSLLQQCWIHEGIQDTGYVLCKMNSLQNAITVLQCSLSNERITGIAGIRLLEYFYSP